MLSVSIVVSLALILLLPAVVAADELTKVIQRDLIALGYDPGNIRGLPEPADVVPQFPEL